MKKILLGLLVLNVSFVSSQWMTNGLNNGNQGNTFGTSTLHPISIWTGNVQKAFFTVGNSITVPWDFNGVFSGSGDGLKILPQVPNSGALDLFTAGQGTTHIKFGGSGAISGQNGRLEHFATGTGFYLDAVNGGFFKFARAGVVTCRVGNNNYWRIGEQTDAANINGARRLEVVDNTAQLRLTRGSSGGYTDFETRVNGNLMILPIGERVGINLNANPTANIDINGDARIRNVQEATPDALFVGVINSGNPNDLNVRRLAFSGNSGEVLLGDGTWGALPNQSVPLDAINGSWVNGNNQVEWGTNTLTHNTIVPMGIYKVLFQTGVNGNNTFSIGGSAYNASSRLYVDNDNLGTGALIRSYPWNGVSTPSRLGLGAYAYSASFLTGVFGLAQIGDNIQGIYGVARDGNVRTIGVRGSSTTTNPMSLVYGADFVAGGTTYFQNVGVRGDANGCVKQNIGGMFRAGNTGELAIGIYGESPDPATYPFPSYAAYFVGGIVTTGATLWVGSDSTLKENITPIAANFDSLLMAVQPVSYDYKQDGDAERLKLPSGIRFGVLAQQIEPLFPSMVSTATHPAEYDTLGVEIHPSFQYKVVDVSQLMPIMLSDLQKKSVIISSQGTQIGILNNSVDSLNSVVTDLNNRLTQLENCLSGILPFLCQMSNSAIQPTQEEVQNQLRTAINVNLSDRNAIELNQNVPNPFAESTVITYSIPASVQKAQIHFYDGQGKLINSVDVIERGNGQLNVFANDLSTGVYTYSLVADGQVVATKRMVKE